MNIYVAEIPVNTYVAEIVEEVVYRVEVRAVSVEQARELAVDKHVNDGGDFFAVTDRQVTSVELAGRS